MSNRLFVATRKGLFTLERSAAGWDVAAVAFAGDAVSVVLPDARRGRVVAALGLGHFGVKLHRSDDRGATYREVPAPAYPPKPEGLDDRDGMGKPVEWRVERLWSLAYGEGDEMWCGTLPGGLFHSRDGGESWSLVRSLWEHEKRHEWLGGGADQPGLHSICVDPRDASHVLVGVSCGGVWASDDHGASWECRATGMRAAYMPPERAYDPYIQDPHLVVRCESSPEVLWSQHHNGVFRSTDDARSWKEIEGIAPSSFGFAVAVHPRDPDTAWLVPAESDEKRVPVGGRVVVTRTRDGGATWQVLSRGLPQKHAYDLVYRHALDVDERGERLAMGSTTGALWISEDQGDSWTEVSAHLPPIHCVRFEK